MTSPSPSEPRTASLYHAALRPASALLLVLGTGVAWIVAIGVLASAGASMEVTVGVSSLTVIAVPIAYVELRGFPFASIGFRWPHPKFFVAAALIGSSSWLINAVLWSWVAEHSDTRYLHRAIEQPPVVVVLVGACVLAPLGEELMFRGILARSFATRLPAIAAIAISSALFSAYHMALPQLGPTFTLGLALAFVALRADSILPTILLHAINNAVVIVLARPDLPDFAWLIEASPVLSFGVAIAMTGGGIALAAKRPT